MKRVAYQPRGFVTNELPIVLTIFAIVCWILASAVNIKSRQSWSGQFLTALVLFVGGVVLFACVAFVGEIVSKRRRPPISTTQKEDAESDKPDAPPNP